ncbi:MAG: hypothetical protein C0425_11360 [Chlorobiaceae bacterium]|nr:hypothetical protein [Chlorobiaceae bacterium]
MEDQSTTFSYAKLDKIQSQIEDLQNQKEKMILHLEKNFIDYLKNKNAFSHHLETLMGAMDEILESLQTQNPSHDQAQLHQRWQKRGSQILKMKKTKKEKSSQTKSEKMQKS